MTPERCEKNTSKIETLEKALSEITESMKKITNSIETIANSISNTVDAHRDELNALNKRVTKTEQMAHSMKSQRDVLLSVGAAIVLFLSAMVFNYYQFKKETRQNFKEIINGKM